VEREKADGKRGSPYPRFVKMLLFSSTFLPSKKKKLLKKISQQKTQQ
jgi:hypothetical protein